MIWLSRIKEESPTIGVWDDHNLDECKQLHYQTSIHLQDAAQHSSKVLEKKIHFSNTKGIHFETSLHDILLHIFNHSTYHRAQIAQDMRRNGLEPINTDYITFVR